jgi:hypothetical protein
MKVYTYSKARQQLATLLKEASREGRVRIRRRDGTLFDVSVAKSDRSGLDVPGIPTDVTAEEIVAAVREGRRRPHRSGPRGARAAASHGSLKGGAWRRHSRG